MLLIVMDFLPQEHCESYNLIFVGCLAVAALLVVHHFFKHQHDLRGSDRFFQPEDVFVLCTHGRFSHEMFVVLFLFGALITFDLDLQYC